jgi:hypothetical protein
VATPDGLGQVPVDASVIADLVASWEGVLGTGLNITAGLHNLFNATNDYLVAYDLGRDRMPGPSRELMVRVGYQSTF